MTSISASVLWWEFKPSFVQYVIALDDGQIDLEGRRSPTEGDPRWFRFSSDSRVGAASPLGQIQFYGSLKFTGHQGMLCVTLTDPRLEIEGDQGSIFVSDGGDDGWETALADLTLIASESDRSVWRTHLTEVGTDLFMGRYLPGDPMGRLILK